MTDTERVEQSNRLLRFGTQWFEIAFEAKVNGRDSDAKVAQLAFDMCKAAHDNLVSKMRR